MSSARVGSGTLRVVGVADDRRERPVDVEQDRRPRSGSARSGASASASVAAVGTALVWRSWAAAGCSTLAAIGTAGGVFSGLFGVGGGVVIVPAARPVARLRRARGHGHLAGRDRDHRGGRRRRPRRLRQRARRGGPARRDPGGRRRPARHLAAAARPGPVDLAALRRCCSSRVAIDLLIGPLIGAILFGVLAGVVAGMLGIGGGALFVPGARALPRPQPPRRGGDLAAGDHPRRARRRLAPAPLRQRAAARRRRARRAGLGRRRSAAWWSPTRCPSGRSRSASPASALRRVRSSRAARCGPADAATPPSLGRRRRPSRSIAASPSRDVDRRAPARRPRAPRGGRVSSPAAGAAGGHVVVSRTGAGARAARSARHVQAASSRLRGVRGARRPASQRSRRRVSPKDGALAKFSGPLPSSAS